MSSDQLQSIFNVDSHDSVPHYELIRLTHHGTNHHSVSRRSIDHHELQKTTNKLNTFADIIKSSQSTGQHHVKKDLSKSTYYSESKSHINREKQQRPLLQQQYSNKQSTNFFSGSTVLEEERIDVQQQHPLLTSTIDLSNIKEHNVSLRAFGDVYNLTLRPTDGLFKDGPQQLKMWSVNTNNNSSEGLEYGQIDEVSFVNHIYIFTAFSFYCFVLYFCYFQWNIR